jgi:uncharacterized protein (DUF1697 family)
VNRAYSADALREAQFNFTRKQSLTDIGCMVVIPNRDPDVFAAISHPAARWSNRRLRAVDILYNPGMALIVFLRGVNVGGHRMFRPSVLARELSDYEVVNVGAAGTFVVCKPGPRAKFRAELLQRLPFETEVVLCDGRDLLRLYTDNPFGAEPSSRDVVRFVSILSKAEGFRASIPIALPPDGEWLVRVIGSKSRFLFGEYRRHMKTIGYLGQIDKLFGVPATTRNWNTITAIVRILKDQAKKDR